MAVVPGGWRALGVSMAAGAIYDAAFAVSILVFTRPAAALLGLEVPPDTVYLGLNGVLLLMLAGAYSLAAMDPVRYQGIAAVAVVGRTAGFVYLASSWRAGRPDAFLALALGDLAFGVLHAVLLIRARRRHPTPNR